MRLIMDAGLGTRLIAGGMRAEEVVSAPRDAVLPLHRADVAAGAEVVLTNTFALPHHHARLDVEARLRDALACAWESHAKHVLVSLGPPACADDAQAMEHVLTSLVLVLRTAPAMGVLFETLSVSDLAWLGPACERLCSASIPVALSFVAGTELPAQLPRGIFALGANCSRAVQREDVAPVLARARALGLQSLYKPAIHDDASWLVAACSPFDMAGVCCGGDASHVAALAAARAA